MGKKRIWEKEIRVRVEWKGNLATEMVLDLFLIKYSGILFIKGHPQLDKKTRPITIEFMDHLTEEEIKYLGNQLLRLHPLYGKSIKYTTHEVKL